MASCPLFQLPLEILDMIIIQHVTDTLPEESAKQIFPLVGLTERSPQQMREFSIPFSDAIHVLRASTQQSGFLQTCHLLRQRYLARLQETIQLRIVERPPTTELWLAPREYDSSFQLSVTQLSSVRHLELLTAPSNIGVPELAKTFPQLRSLLLHLDKKPLSALKSLHRQTFASRDALTAKHVLAAVRQDAKDQFHCWSSILTDKRVKLQLTSTYGIWVLNYRRPEPNNQHGRWMRLVAECLDVTVSGHGGSKEETEEMEVKVEVAAKYGKALRIWKDKGIKKMRSGGPL